MSFVRAIKRSWKSVSSWTVNHWKTIAVLALSTVVFVGVTALTGGLGAPAMAALLAGGFSSGVAGYTLGNLLDHEPVTVRGALTAGAVSAVTTVATAGVLRLASPLFSVVAKPLVAALPEAMTEAGSPLVVKVAAGAASGSALGAGTQVVTNAVTGKPLGQNVREAAIEGGLNGAMMEPATRLVGLAVPEHPLAGDETGAPTARGRGIVGALEGEVGGTAEDVLVQPAPKGGRSFHELFGRPRVRTEGRDPVSDSWSVMKYSPRLTTEVAHLQERGWHVDYNGERGSATSGRQIVLESHSADDPVALVRDLAHEAGHAEANVERGGPPVADYRPGMKEKTYVDRSVAAALDDEAAAALHQAEIRREILANGGPDIGGQKKVLAIADDSGLTVAEKRARLASLFAEMKTSTDGERYGAYYKKLAQEKWASLERGRMAGRVDGELAARNPLEAMRASDAELVRRHPADMQAKYEKMALDPFSYYRGSARLFFEDLQHGWAVKKSVGKSAEVWVTGDLHLQNMGSQVLGDKSLVFAMNDFDEASRAPFTWDVLRMSTSFVLAGDTAGIPRAKSLEASQAFADAYVKGLEDVASGKLTQDWRLTKKDASPLVKAVLEEGKAAGHGKLLEKLTHMDGAVPAFKTGDSLVEVSRSERAAVTAGMKRYVDSIPADARRDAETYRVLDVVRKTGKGTGSVGLDRYFVLVRGKSSAPGDARILEVKEERASAVDEALGRKGGDNGERVVEGTRALLGDPSAWVGSTRIDGKPFLVKELSPHDAKIDLADVRHGSDLIGAAEDMGRIVARAHAFSDLSRGVSGPEKARAILEAAGNGFGDDVRSFAKDYADKMASDFHAFVAALDAEKGSR